MAVALTQVITEDRASGSQVIDGSLKFVSGNSNYLSRTPGSAGNQKTWTFSVWIKRLKSGGNPGIFMPVTGGDGFNESQMRFDSSNRLQVYDSGGAAGYLNVVTTRVFRDFSSWYHLVFTYDSTQPTSSNRFRIYVNGVQETSFSTETYPNQNNNSGWNNTSRHDIGRVAYSSNNYIDTYLSNAHFIDGLALGPQYFGFTDPLTNTWRPKKFKAQGTTVNDGTVWSSGIPGNTLSGYPATNAFDGNLSNFVYADNGTTMTWTAPKRITGQKIEVYVYAGNTHPIVSVNGLSTGAVVGSIAQQNVWVDVTNLCGGPGGTLETITAYGQTIGGTPRSSGFAAVRVDGVIMVDNTTQNLAFGTNGFYLPMDGNSPIGQDQSGRGNNWTPVNFGGSNTIEKATGALPILNTVSGGKVAVPGVFGSKVSKTLTTTASTNTSNGFVFANEGTKPTLSFVRGATYTFDYSASTGHPLRFATASDAAGSTEYTDGTDTSVANTVKITVPHNAPDTLYYYCTNHGGMGNTISVTTDEKVADPYAWKNVLALPLVGSSADVSNQINVGSTTKTMTANGNAAASSAQSNFYGGSFAFDGSGDYLVVSENSELLINGTECTIEGWYYVNSSFAGLEGSSLPLFAQVDVANGSTSGTANFWSFADATYLYFGSSTGNISVSKNLIPIGKWFHYAAVVTGTTNAKLFIDGVLVGSGTIGAIGSGNGRTTNLGITRSGGGGSASYLNGYISDFRVYKGVAKYTSNFIPASTSPDILPDTPSGVAGGSALTSIPDSATEGAVVFDGSGDYIGAPSSTDYDLNGVDWTVEFYMYATSLSGGKVIAENRTDGAGGWSIQLSGTSLAFYLAGAWNPSNTLSVAKWHHVALVRSSSTTTLYVDGISKGTTASDAGSTASNGMFIGARSSPNYEFPGFISNFRVVKGTAVYTSNFTPPTAPLTNITNTKLLCCQSTTSATAAAVIPTGSFTANGNAAASKFSPFMPDNINAVRGQESGYATFNPLQTTAVASSDANLTNGNLDISFTASANNYSSYLTQSIESGKFYFEVTINSSTTTSSTIGFVGDNNLESKRNATASAVPGLQGTYGKGVDGTGTLYNGSGSSEGSYMSSWSQGDVIMVQIDADNDRFYLGKNGILQTTAITFPAGTTKPYHFGVGDSSGSVAASFSLNTGQKPFKYAPPEGFKTLCLANLPRPTEAAVRPDKYFNTVLWTGAGGTKTVSGVGFQPDFVWIKNRGRANSSHVLVDAVRGSTKSLSSNLTNSEVTTNGTDDFRSFDSDGFTVGDSSNYFVNSIGDTHVAWCWKAGGAAVSNSDGSITSQVSANRDSGFSVVTWTGDGNTRTIGHGLSATPSLILLKYRNTASNWSVHHKNLSSGYRLKLNSTDGQSNDTGISNLTDSTFTIDISYNNYGNTYVAYCFSEVAGYSKFGSYTGNGSTDGPFCFTGHRPKFLLVKQTNTTGDWVMLDTERVTYNPTNRFIAANTANAENTPPASETDFLSNGFKIRTSWSGLNTSGGTYIFAAFAEAPTQNLFGGQANAR